MLIETTKNSKILAELKKRRSLDKTVSIEDEQVELVYFTLSDRYYACYGTDAKEILPVLRINPIPGAPNYILGVVNVRGDIESVLDLNRILGVPSQPKSNKNRIIIGECDGVRSGMLTGVVHDVLSVPKNTIHPPLSTLTESIKNFVAGETTYNSNNVTLLNIGEIFKTVLQVKE